MNHAAIVFGYYENAVTKIHIQVLVWTYVLISLGWIPMGGIARTYGKTVLNLRELTNCFQSCLLSLHAHQQCMRIPFFSTSFPTFVIVFSVIAILMDMKYYCFVVLLCISPMTYGVEHFLYAYLSSVDLLWWGIC